MSTDNIFSVADRERVQERVLQWAKTDGRIVAGAVVGALALDDGGDRWSDLDLTFGVADDQFLPAVLEDWTRRLDEEFDAVQLFDLPVGGQIKIKSMITIKKQNADAGSTGYREP